jgi:hypothetical protein
MISFGNRGTIKILLNKKVMITIPVSVGELIDKALAKVGKSGKKAVSTPTSDEMDDTLTQSPMKAFKGYKR